METIDYDFFCSALGPGNYALIGIGWAKHVQGYMMVWEKENPHNQTRFYLHSN